MSWLGPIGLEFTNINKHFIMYSLCVGFVINWADALSIWLCEVKYGWFWLQLFFFSFSNSLLKWNCYYLPLDPKMQSVLKLIVDDVVVVDANIGYCDCMFACLYPCRYIVRSVYFGYCCFSLLYFIYFFFVFYYCIWNQRRQWYEQTYNTNKSQYIK